MHDVLKQISSFIKETFDQLKVVHKAPSTFCNIQLLQIVLLFSKITNKAWYFTILMKYHTVFSPYFFRKLRKIPQNLSSAAVVIGALGLTTRLNASRNEIYIDVY